MGFRSEGCVKIGSENIVPGVFAPGCHVALEDPHHTSGNLEFAFLPSVFALFCSRDDRRGCSFPCRSCHTSAAVPNQADFHRTAHRLEKERDSHKIVECVLKAFAEQLSAFSNLCEKWCQFHFTLAGQRRGPLTNFIELGVEEQFRKNGAGAAGAYVAFFSKRNSGRGVSGWSRWRRREVLPVISSGKLVEAELVQPFPFL